jgi:hypothetical protein
LSWGCPYCAAQAIWAQDAQSVALDIIENIVTLADLNHAIYSRKTPAIIKASPTVPVEPARLHDLAHWLVSADLDLRPFYRIAAPHPIMGLVL